MAAGALAHRTVLAGIVARELGVAIAAEFMEGGFQLLRQIFTCAAVAVITSAEAGAIDEVVMAGDAIDAAVIFMRKKSMQRGGGRGGPQQMRRADAGRQKQQREQCDARRQPRGEELFRP